MKGCGRCLANDDYKFYCGKKCEWCYEIHYCDDCLINLKEETKK